MDTRKTTARPFRTWNRDRLASLVEHCSAEMFDIIRAGGTPSDGLEWGWFNAAMELKYRDAEELARRAARPAGR